jgi:hypothetical protein
MSTKIKELLRIVDLELQKAQKYYDATKESAHEIAKTALTSHSQAGDRFHSQGAMEISKERLNGILKLKEELERIKDRIELEFTEVPCYIKTDKTDFYLVKNAILITGVKLVSLQSELGKEIINKQVGDMVNGFKILEIQ